MRYGTDEEVLGGRKNEFRLEYVEFELPMECSGNYWRRKCDGQV